MKSFKIFIVLGFVIPLYLFSRQLQGLIDYEMAKTLFSSATFLFGIFVAFSISNAHSRINAIYEALNTHNAELLFIYASSERLGKDIQNKIQKLIDDYIISQLDYYLVDFKYSYPTFNKLSKYLIHLESEGEIQKEVVKSYVGCYLHLIQQRKTVEVSARSKLVFFDWFALYLLSGIIIFFIYYLSDNTVFSLITSSALVLVVVALILLLDSLNDLSWKERSKIWRPLHQLFIELDLLPYYPDEIIMHKRSYIKKGEKVRIAHYSNPYPNMKDKNIEVVEY